MLFTDKFFNGITKPCEIILNTFDWVCSFCMFRLNLTYRYHSNDLSLHGSEKANTQLTCHYWGLSIKWHAAPACNQGCFVLTQNYWLNWTLWLSLPTACWRPTPSPASTALCRHPAIPPYRHTAPTPRRLYKTKYKLLLQKWQPPIYCKK